MSILAGLNPITAIANVANLILTRILPDKAVQAEAAAEIQKMVVSGEINRIAAEYDSQKNQVLVNQEEAKSDNLFVAGWRPALGWVCVLTFAFYYIIAPFIVNPLLIEAGHAALPLVNLDQIIGILLGMLGLGTMRTIEKIKGVNK